MRKILLILVVIVISGIGVSGFSQTTSKKNNFDEYDLVIIAPNEFSSHIQPLINHKNSKNVLTF